MQKAFGDVRKETLSVIEIHWIARQKLIEARSWYLTGTRLFSDTPKLLVPPHAKALFGETSIFIFCESSVSLRHRAQLRYTRVADITTSRIPIH